MHTYNDARELIDGAQTIAVFGHTHPDGDSIGSSMGMGLLLENMGKQVTYVLPDTPAKIFDFLPEIGKYTTEFDYGEYDLCIFLDCADTSRVSQVRRDRPDYFAQQTILNIDHHISNPGYGKVNLVDAKASSTCELLTEMFQDLYPEHMDANLATYLYMGIATDTGNFAYENDPARTFAASLTLIALGADKELITYHIFRKNSLPAIKFKAKLIQRITEQGKVLYSRYTDTEILEQNMDQEGIAEHFLVTFTSIDHDGIYMLFKIMEQEGEYHLRCSWRSQSDDYDVSEMAKHFGGGGHKRAAGCKITLNPGDYISQVEEIVKQANQLILQA